MVYFQGSLPSLRVRAKPTASIPGRILSQIAEPPMPYRRRPAHKLPPAGVPPTEEIERRVRARDHGARWRQITALNRRLSTTLTGDVRATWLSLEECLHDHWLDVALEHYRVGFKAGGASAYVSRVGSGSRELRSRLQALATALALLLTELEEGGEQGDRV